MRTTLNLSEEALAKIRKLSLQRNATLGQVASELIIEALRPGPAQPVRNGVRVFPAENGPPPDLELVNTLRDPPE